MEGSQKTCDSDRYIAIISALSATIVILLLGGWYMKRRLVHQFLYQPSSAWKVKFDELQMIKKLGEGAFGAVFKARWHGKDVAVKVFNEDKFKGVHVTAFVLEVAILHELRHPNIVLFMGACFEKPKLALVTELLKCSLYDFIASLKEKANQQHGGGNTGSILFSPVSSTKSVASMVPWHDRLQMLLDACHGMSYLHEIGMLHHDLKSPNLLLGSYNNCKVADFGMISLKPGSRKRQLLRKSTEYLENTSDKTSRIASSPLNKIKRNRNNRSFKESSLFLGGGRNSTKTVDTSKDKDKEPEAGKMSPLLSPGNLFRKSTKKLDNIPSLDVGNAGTPQWTAPEVIEGYEFTEKADVFSFGIIMAEVVNLADPYPGMTPYEVSIKVAEGELRPTLEPTCPPAIKAIVDACLAQDPKTRPSFLVLGQQLESIHLEWLEKGAPDNLSSKFISAQKTRRGSTAGDPHGKQPGTFKSKFSQKSWWVDEEKVTFSATISYGEYGETRRAEYAVIDQSSSSNKFKMSKQEGSSTRRTRKHSMSILGGLGGEIKKKYTFTDFGFKPKTQSLASNNNGSPGLTGSLIFNFARPKAATAVEPSEMKDVVVKLVNINGRSDLMEQFSREMDRRIVLSHPNIEVVLGGWISFTNLALVKENCSIGTFQDVLSSSTSSQLRISELIQISKGLGYLHSQDKPIVHKDIRCAKVLCYEGGEEKDAAQGESCLTLKLTGFMFDFVPKALSKAEQKLGLPAWAPPEVLMTEQYDESSDVYSFGVMCWETLTKAPPFEDQAFHDIARLVCMDKKRPEFPPFSEALFNCSETVYQEFCGLIEKCWEGDSSKRPSLDEVRTALYSIYAAMQ